VEDVYGDRVVVVPYVMPGFDLAKAVKKALDKVDPFALDGIILLNHGIFTMHDDAKTSYELMIQLVTEAEIYLSTRLGKKFSFP
jgi:rhamnose utilization protein RhaD (predicted bifunctional aldolase and dehydrogenase)